MAREVWRGSTCVRLTYHSNKLRVAVWDNKLLSGLPAITIKQLLGHRISEV